MNIRTLKDDTGFAPADSRFHAIDDDTYAGLGSPIGFGATEIDAELDLLCKLKATGRLASTLPFTVMLCAPDTLAPYPEYLSLHVEGYFPMHAVANARDMAMDQYDAWDDEIDPTDFAIVFVGHGHQHSLA